VCASEGVGRKEGGKEFPRGTTMDDLEDLLSDLNSTLGGIGSGSSSPSARSQVAATSRPDAYGAASKYSSSSEPSLSDLDALLGDLKMETTRNKKVAPVPQQRRQDARLSNLNSPASSTRSSSQKVKCGCPQIGGMQYRMGAAGVGETVCCNRLLCTKCDLAVVSFPDSKWSEDADYMFFRNGYPDEKKLSSGRLPKKGSRAYCCQCMWTGAEKAEAMGFTSRLRWVCRGHQC